MPGHTSASVGPLVPWVDADPDTLQPPVPQTACFKGFGFEGLGFRSACVCMVDNFFF